MDAALRHGGDQGLNATPRILCRLEDIEDGDGKGFTFGEGTARREIFVIREDDRIWAYENVCPHAGTPLDWQPDRFMNADGSYIMCHTHGALFRIEDGFCVAGPCADRSLTPVSVGLDERRRVVLMPQES